MRPNTEGFLAFAKTKEPNEKYDYGSPTDCPIAQYLKSLGHTDVFVEGYGQYYINHASVGELPRVAKAANPPAGNAALDWNWGDLVQRLEAML